MGWQIWRMWLANCFNYKYGMSTSLPERAPLLESSEMTIKISASAFDKEAGEAKVPLPALVAVNPVSDSSDDFKDNPFQDPKVAEHYRRLYENVDYECRHAFDPDLEWTTQEERKLVRKLDWHVTTWACVMFFALQVDRGNLKQAVSADMLEELGLSTNDYNYGRISAP